MIAAACGPPLDSGCVGCVMRTNSAFTFWPAGVALNVSHELSASEPRATTASMSLESKIASSHLFR